MIAVDDGRRAYIEARLKAWRTQYKAISVAILTHIEDNRPAPDHLSNELSRLSWLIAHAREELRMTRIMYDSTDPNLIPTNAPIVCWYPHAWGTDMSKHTNALQVRIDNRGDHADDCHVLDVENGAATPSIAANWVDLWHRLHPSGLDMVNGWCRKPVIYCSTSMLSAVRSALAGRDYDVWAAQWDGNTTPIAGCFAKQYIDHGPAGENYDMSYVYDDMWGVKPVTPAPVPVPAPAPKPPVLEGLVTWADNSWNGHARLVTSTDGGHTWT